jgi:hypothetical protein
MTIRIKNEKAKDHKEKIFTMKENKYFRETLHVSRRFLLPHCFKNNSYICQSRTRVEFGY